MLNRKNRFFKNYKRHGYKLEEDKVRLDNFRKECQEAVENAKFTYLANMGRNEIILLPVKSLTGKLSIR